jgi:hypothetical protein
MNLQKQFSFTGKFRNKHGRDDNPIEITITNIFCNKNGNVFLEANSEISERIGHKRFFESVPIHQVQKCPSVTENDLLDTFSFFQMDNLEKDLVQLPYEGDYLIEGKLNEEWTISANILDANFTASFNNKNLDENTENYQKYLVNLSDFCVDYNPEYSQG